MANETDFQKDLDSLRADMAALTGTVGKLATVAAHRARCSGFGGERCHGLRFRNIEIVSLRREMGQEILR
jgi:hypothetical protein